MNKFINRRSELAFLDRSWSVRSPQLVVLYGRRRVGKTALLRQFAEGRSAFHYMATRLPEAQQLRELGQGLGAIVDDSLLVDSGFQNWGQVFTWISRQKRRFAFMIDEFPYLVEANPALPSLLQRAWDQELRESKSFMVLCGSSVAMMEREVLSERAPLYGRRTGQLRLAPLLFRDACEFFPRYGFEDRVRAWSVLGGVPYYLQLFDDRRSLRANIRTTILDTGAPLQEEVEFLLRQELREPRVYFGILAAIAAGKRKLSEILNATGLSSPTVTKYLSVLQGLGLVLREVPATELKPEKSKKGLYAIADPFVRFWFRFVLPQRALLETRSTMACLTTPRVCAGNGPEDGGFPTPRSISWRLMGTAPRHSSAKRSGAAARSAPTFSATSRRPPSSSSSRRRSGRGITPSSPAQGSPTP